MRSYVDRLLPYLMVNVTRHHISLFPPITNPLYCTRHTVSVSLAHHAQILLGYPTVYRVTQQNWYLLRTMRLHIYQAMGIPICFSRVDKTRVTFSQRALVLLKELNNNNALPENDRFLVRSYDSSKQTLSTIIRHYADSDVLVLHSYEERLNIWVPAVLLRGVRAGQGLRRGQGRALLVQEDCGEDVVRLPRGQCDEGGRGL